MAAYAVLISLGQTLKDFIQRNQHQIRDHHGKVLQSLQQNLIFLQEVSDSSPRKVSKWEAKIHDATNEAESIIEDYISETVWNEGITLNEKQHFFLEMNKVVEIIDSVVDEMRREVEIDGTEDQPPPPDQTHDKLIGFEDHFTEIINRLVDHSSELRTIPVVGMGGIGKTALARAVYSMFDSKGMRRHFDLCRWVAVSQSYNVKAILLAILGVENPSEDMDVSIRDLGVQVNHLLYGKRYLIVLDDIWDLSAWDEVQSRLRDDRNRSRILLTTRLQDVALYTKQSSSIYQLQLMDMEKSWSMLEYKVFGDTHCPPELQEVGKRIAEGCSGLPLAIVVIAGILVNVNQSRDSWEKIAEDVTEAIESSDDHILKIFALSYQHLPHYLRPCFLYLGAYPKSFDFHVKWLLTCWVAEGFLRGKNSSMDIEQTAYECVEELLKRNLIISTGKEFSGRTKSFTVHGLLRNLSHKIAHEEKFLQRNHNSIAEMSTSRRASFFAGESSQFVSAKQPYLRTVICYGENNRDLLPEFQRCGRLRILHTRSLVVEKFPPELFKLCHLRHLTLTSSQECGLQIPQEIHKLENLETLAIWVGGVRYRKFKSHILPVEIWKIPKLRRIDFAPASYLPSPTCETCPLENFSSLDIVRNFQFEEVMVKLFPNLKTLDLCYDIAHTQEFWSEYDFQNLCHLTHLEKLKIFWYYGQPRGLVLPMELPQMNSVTFPSSLKVLKLRGGAVAASWEDMTRAIGPLPNLQVLKVSEDFLFGDTWEIKEGDFPDLRVLEMASCELWASWRNESSDPFPRLRKLSLLGCPFLTELPDGFGGIQDLESITLTDHQKAIMDWAMQILEEQEDMGNDLFQVEFIPVLGSLRECGDDESDKAALMSSYLHKFGNGVFKKALRSIIYDYEELWLSTSSKWKEADSD